MPWSTLKDFLKRAENIDTEIGRCVDLPKFGKPFVLSVEMEKRIYKHILTMQDLGLGLTVAQIRKLAFQLAETVGKTPI